MTLDGVMDAQEQLAADRERLHVKIEGALKRIRAGTYGACADCGFAIDPLRLAARPETELCSDCSGEGSFER